MSTDLFKESSSSSRKKKKKERGENEENSRAWRRERNGKQQHLIEITIAVASCTYEYVPAHTCVTAFCLAHFLESLLSRSISRWFLPLTLLTLQIGTNSFLFLSFFLSLFFPTCSWLLKVVRVSPCLLRLRFFETLLPLTGECDLNLFTFEFFADFRFLMPLVLEKLEWINQKITPGRKVLSSPRGDLHKKSAALCCTGFQYN